MNVPDRPDWSVHRVCQRGHRGCYIPPSGGWHCPVPTCDPFRVIDLVTATLVWEGEVPDGVVA